MVDEYLIQLGLMIAGELTGIVLLLALFNRDVRSSSNRILACLVMGVMYVQFIYTLEATGLIHKFPFLLRSNFPFMLLNQALILAYIKSMTQKDYRWRFSAPVFCGPFIFGVLWYVVFLLFVKDPRFWEFGQTLEWEQYTRLIITTVLMGLYVRRAFQLLREFEVKVNGYFSDVHLLYLPWLRGVMMIAAVGWALRFLDVLTGPYFPMWRAAPAAGTFSLLGLVYLALKQSPVFLRELPMDEPKRKLLFSPEKMLEDKSRLQTYLWEKKPYLNPNLRLSDLCEEMKMTHHEMSQLINEGLNLSFYELINALRVEEAKRRLLDPKYSHMNILGIATDCGFNSKSVFNQAFKKIAGKTPSDFRNSPT